jgi:hypothetical protein
MDTLRERLRICIVKVAIKVLQPLLLLTVVSATIPEIFFMRAQSSDAAQAPAPKARAGASARDGKEIGAEPKVLPPPLARIVDASRQTPPEFHAYSLLLLAESGRIEEKRAALGLLREAFETAQSAAEPVNKKLAIDQVLVSSDVGLWMFKREFGLDRTSLTARSIADADKLDPAAARTMLADTHWATAEPASCNAAITGDPVAYYNLMTQLASNKAANRNEGRDQTEAMLEPAVLDLRTHREAELALRLIASADLTTSQRNDLARHYTGQLERLRGDERGFAALLLDREYNQWIHDLKNAFSSMNETTARSLLHDFRSYLVENARQGGCGAHWMRRKDEAGKQLLPRAIEAFNQQLASELAHAGLEPIALDEIASSAPVVEGQVQRYGQSQEALDLLEAGKALRFNTSGQRRTVEDLNSSAWSEQATQFLGRVDDWQADPFNSEDVFWTKMEFYTGVIDLVPREDLRWLAVEKAIAQLENSRLETDNPSMMMVYAFHLHNRATSQMNGDERQERSGRNLTRRLMGSSSPSLRLLGLLEAEGLKPMTNRFM